MIFSKRRNINQQSWGDNINEQNDEWSSILKRSLRKIFIVPDIAPFSSFIFIDILKAFMNIAKNGIDTRNELVDLSNIDIELFKETYYKYQEASN